MIRSLRHFGATSADRLALMFLPWNRKIEVASPRHWILRKLAGSSTIVLNASFDVTLVDDGAVSVLRNPQGDTLVANVDGLGIPGYGRLVSK